MLTELPTAPKSSNDQSQVSFPVPPNSVASAISPSPSPERASRRCTDLSNASLDSPVSLSGRRVATPGKGMAHGEYLNKFIHPSGGSPEEPRARVFPMLQEEKCEKDVVPSMGGLKAPTMDRVGTSAAPDGSGDSVGSGGPDDMTFEAFFQEYAPSWGEGIDGEGKLTEDAKEEFIKMHPDERKDALASLRRDWGLGAEDIITMDHGSEGGEEKKDEGSNSIGRQDSLGSQGRDELLRQVVIELEKLHKAEENKTESVDIAPHQGPNQEVAQGILLKAFALLLGNYNELYYTQRTIIIGLTVWGVLTASYLDKVSYFWQNAGPYASGVMTGLVGFFFDWKKSNEDAARETGGCFNSFLGRFNHFKYTILIANSVAALGLTLQANLYKDQSEESWIPTLGLYLTLSASLIGLIKDFSIASLAKSAVNQNNARAASAGQVGDSGGVGEDDEKVEVVVDKGSGSRGGSRVSERPGASVVYA